MFFDDHIVPHFKSIIYLEKCSQKSDVLSGRKKHGCDEGTRNTGSQGSWYFSSVCRAVLVVSKTALHSSEGREFGSLVRSKPSPRLSVEKRELVSLMTL